MNLLLGPVLKLILSSADLRALNNPIFIVNIFDSLDSFIQKSNSVAARGCESISGLSLLEFSSTVVIIDSILVSIDWGLSIARGQQEQLQRQLPGLA